MVRNQRWLASLSTEPALDLNYFVKKWGLKGYSGLSKAYLVQLVTICECPELPEEVCDVTEVAG